MARLKSMCSRSSVTSARVRTRPIVSPRTWPLKVQVVAALVTFALSAWLTVTSISYFGNRTILTDTAGRIADLERAYADLLAQSEASRQQLANRLEALDAAARQQRQLIEELTSVQMALRQQLETRERQLEGVIAQRDEARKAVAELQQTIASTEERLESAIQQRASLEARLKEFQTRLAELDRERVVGREVEFGLRWQLARLENELNQLRDHSDNTTQVWLKDWVLGSADALEQLFDDTGVDLGVMLARAANESVMGQGGPLQVADPSAGDAAEGRARDGIPEEIQRLAALQKLARTLPLGLPLDHFYVTSPYGKRKDPFNKKPAFHAGLDLGAAKGTKVLATAPGRVITAGPTGAYGNLVEIDHGMGVVTRYGHMQSVLVKVGDEVSFRQPIGIVGSTGRSTARHLHYEVRIDGKTYDAARFLNAGRRLVGVFGMPPNDPEVPPDSG